ARPNGGAGRRATPAEVHPRGDEDQYPDRQPHGPPGDGRGEHEQHAGQARQGAGDPPPLADRSSHRPPSAARAAVRSRGVRAAGGALKIADAQIEERRAATPAARRSSSRPVRDQKRPPPPPLPRPRPGPFPRPRPFWSPLPPP